MAKLTLSERDKCPKCGSGNTLERDYEGIKGVASKAQEDMLKKGWRKVEL